jgi:hypothetical protein
MYCRRTRFQGIEHVPRRKVRKKERRKEGKKEKEKNVFIVKSQICLCKQQMAAGYVKQGISLSVFNSASP